jgi:hypothetical protein
MSAPPARMGNDARANVLPVTTASGPGFLGPNYSPADEMLPPASIGVRRGGDLGDVIGAVKGVIYYGDMMGFGEASSGFTKGMPGLKPLGVNYFINSGLTCSNGATMWEYVQTIPTGSALGPTIQNAIRGVGLPELRGMAPGILEDAKSALDPSPVINAVVGSGYPQCRLMKMKVGDFDGKITNVDGVLLVDPNGLIIGSDGAYYQERWIQDRKVPSRRPGETKDQQFMRGDPIQLSYDSWNSTPKIYRDNGCLLDTKSNNESLQPSFCRASAVSKVITLQDGTTFNAFSDNSRRVGYEGFEDYHMKLQSHRITSFTVAALSLMGLFMFWKIQKN